MVMLYHVRDRHLVEICAYFISVTEIRRRSGGGGGRGYTDAEKTEENGRIRSVELPKRTRESTLERTRPLGYVPKWDGIVREAS